MPRIEGTSPEQRVCWSKCYRNDLDSLKTTSIFILKSHRNSTEKFKRDKMFLKQFFLPDFILWKHKNGLLLSNVFSLSLWIAIIKVIEYGWFILGDCKCMCYLVGGQGLKEGVLLLVLNVKLWRKWNCRIFLLCFILFSYFIICFIFAFYYLFYFYFHILLFD